MNQDLTLKVYFLVHVAVLVMGVVMIIDAKTSFKEVTKFRFFGYLVLSALMAVWGFQLLRTNRIPEVGQDFVTRLVIWSALTPVGMFFGYLAFGRNSKRKTN